MDVKQETINKCFKKLQVLGNLLIQPLVVDEAAEHEVQRGIKAL